MTPGFRVRSPRIEVSEALPFISPEHGLEPARQLAAEGPAKFAAASLSALRQPAADGQTPGKAALAMLGDGLADAEDALAAATSADQADGLYEMAVRADLAGRVDDAILILALLAGAQGGERDGLLGLSVIAARQGRIDEAFDLATACLGAEDRHPRACSIVGICELERGNKAGAQAFLATASRLARRREEYRAELQIAQRALLLMHLG